MHINIKRAIKSRPALHAMARWINSRLKGTWKYDPSIWIGKIVSPASAQIVQIGSNDGKTGDPLHRLLRRRRRWKALFVEPIPYLFDRLKGNYNDPKRFAFENTLINDGSPAQFFWVDPAARQSLKDLPPWYDQLGSFNRHHITYCLPVVEPFINESLLPGMTLEALLTKHSILNVDILHIDTEGADYSILRQLNLDVLRPRVILFEHKHLAKEEAEASVRFLAPYYSIYRLRGDTLAVPPSADALLQAAGLQPLSALVSLESSLPAGARQGSS
ncbi:FkbM family methyltransferase [Verrucomicrobium sp. BvORR106]|uniref:FkbM family methyltransferase n=1 Tax=Verrucomicrobium sp. BvORR106 TaxID=1403819 RepID=UPI00056FEE1F|nr:FkbM family methyltransferase [Verrucomicrobium sp. BvORR106]